jgi:hypothetical protein
MLIVFFTFFLCFLGGISMLVLTIALSLPMVFLRFSSVLLLWFAPGLATWRPAGMQG